MKENILGLYKKYYCKNNKIINKHMFTNKYISYIIKFIIPVLLGIVGVIIVINGYINLGIPLLVLSIFISLISMKKINNTYYFLENINTGEYRFREIVIEDLLEDIERVKEIDKKGKVKYSNKNHYRVKYNDGISIEVPKEIYNSLAKGKKAYCCKMNEEIIILPEK